MEICEQNEAFVEKDGDLEFSHTKIILRQEQRYYYTRSVTRYSDPSEVNISELSPVEIPVSKMWPPFQEGFTQAPDPLPPNCFVKRPTLIDCEDNASLTNSGTLMINEIRVCETLILNPHPNIARYLGCLVEDGRIVGLCFVKYDMNLSERVQMVPEPLDADLILSGIEKGILHLHGLGLIHCDINPTNILLEKDNPVIGDFDSCQPKGQKLGLKGGTMGWTKEEFNFAMPENDEYGLSKIAEFLRSRRL